MLKHARTGARWSEKNIGQKGFTLIELLVVIIILGVLAGIVVLSVNGLRDSGSNQACETEAKTAESAAAAFYADYDSWPNSSTELHTAPNNYMEAPQHGPFTINGAGQIDIDAVCNP